jgi:hypothetical protein
MSSPEDEAPMNEISGFSRVARECSASRPGYPGKRYDWLASVVRRPDVAWDAATGDGQAAADLAARFDRVIATDRSEAQIRHAKPHPRVEYRGGAPRRTAGRRDRGLELSRGSRRATVRRGLRAFYRDVISSWFAPAIERITGSPDEKHEVRWPRCLRAAVP